MRTLTVICCRLKNIQILKVKVTEATSCSREGHTGDVYLLGFLPEISQV